MAQTKTVVAQTRKPSAFEFYMMCRLAEMKNHPDYAHMMRIERFCIAVKLWYSMDDEEKAEFSSAAKTWSTLSDSQKAEFMRRAAEPEPEPEPKPVKAA